MSQLRILLQRVESSPGKQIPHIVSVINYLRYYNDWEPNEREKALDLLNKVGVDLSPKSDEVLLSKYYGPSYRWRRACIRCGQILHGNSHMINGLSKSCYEIVGDGQIEDMRPLPKALLPKPKKVSANSFLSSKNSRREKLDR